MTDWNRKYRDGVDKPVFEEMSAGVELAWNAVNGLLFAVFGFFNPDKYMGEVCLASDTADKPVNLAVRRSLNISRRFTQIFVVMFVLYTAGVIQAVIKVIF